MLQFYNVIQWKAFQEQSSENLEVPWQMDPHSDTLSTHSQLEELLVQGIYGLDVVVMFIQYGEYTT